MYTKDYKENERIRRKIHHIAGHGLSTEGRPVDEITESFWKVFGIKIKPGPYHTHTGKEAVMDPTISTTPRKDVSTEESIRIGLWASILGTLLQQHFKSLSAGSALQRALEKVPPKYSQIKDSYDEIIENILIPEMEYSLGPLRRKHKKQIEGLAKVALIISDALLAGTLHSGHLLEKMSDIYRQIDVERHLKNILMKTGISPSQTREQIIKILKEHDLEDFVHPDFLEREKEPAIAGTPTTKIIIEKEPSEPIPEPLAGVFKALEDKIKPDERAIIELRLTLAGEMTLEELSERWERYGFSLLDLLKKEGALRNALREAVEEFRKAGFGVLPVPREVLPLIANPNLETVTAARLFYSALESVAVRGLPERGEEIIELVTGILERVPAFSPYVEEIPKELERSAEPLAKTLALMKDPSYLEILEAELAPLLEKVPETRKVGLFKRDSPRRKVEDFAALLMEGNLGENEAERKAGELKEYLKGYLTSEDAGKLVAGLMLPFRARKLLEKYGTAEGFLFEYAHSLASRMLSLEGALVGGEMPNREELVRIFAFLPGVKGTTEVPLKKFEENTGFLGEFPSRHD